MSNILLVHNRYRIKGGEDTAFDADAEFLRSRGHRVFTYIRDNSETDSFGLLEKVCIPFTAVFSLKTYNEIKDLIRKEHIDRVYVHNTWFLISPSVFHACFSCHVPVTLRVHNYRLLCPAGTFFRPGIGICEECVHCSCGRSLFPALKHKCYRGSIIETFMMVMSIYVHRFLHTYRRVKISVLTGFMKEKIMLHPDIKEKNVSIRGNRACIDPASVPDREDAGTYYLYVGRLSEEKGIMKLLEVYGKYRLDGGDKDLVVCGDGPLSEKCKEYVLKNKIDGITFTGAILHDETLKYIKGAAALIVPSLWYEGYPMVIAEARALGTKVIGSDIGNVKELRDAPLDSVF